MHPDTASQFATAAGIDARWGNRSPQDRETPNRCEIRGFGVEGEAWDPVEDIQGDRSRFDNAGAEGRGGVAPDTGQPQLVTLYLDPTHPDPVRSMQQWQQQHPPGTHQPHFQVLGVEQLTRQPARMQREFLAALEQLDTALPLWESSLVIWLPRPWLHAIRQSAVHFWQWHTGIFEFEGEPTPLSAIPDRPPARVVSSHPAPRQSATPALLRPPALPEHPSGAEVLLRWQGVTAGDRTEPAVLSEAIAAYRQALRQRDLSEDERRDLLEGLGHFHRCQARNLPATAADQAKTHLHDSLEAYRQLLNRLDPETDALACSTTYHSLGLIYSDLAQHEAPAVNLERAIAAYRAAINRRGRPQPGDRPALHWYASTANNLGTACWNLAQHHHAPENLQRAIAAYRKALDYYRREERREERRENRPEPGTPRIDSGTHLPDRDRLPPDASYGMIQANLGTAYLNLSQHDPNPDWLLRAIQAYQVALQYRTRHDRPAAYAATQNNLGTAYWHLAQRAVPQTAPDGTVPQARRDRRTAWQAAAAAYAQALDVPNTVTLSFDRHATASQLGLVYYQLATDPYATLSPEDILAQLDRALDCYLKALAGWHDSDHKAEIALGGLVQTLRAIYRYAGSQGQIAAFAHIPSHWMAKILRQL